MIKKALFKLKFSTPKYDGFLYVQDSTFALVKGEYISKSRECLGNLMSDTRRLYLNFDLDYAIVNDLFRLSYINYQTALVTKKTRRYT